MYIRKLDINTRILRSRKMICEIICFLFPTYKKIKTKIKTWKNYQGFAHEKFAKGINQGLSNTLECV